VLQSFGYSDGISNLLAAPPVISAVASALIFAYLSDKFRLRGPFIAVQCVMVIVGLMITAYHKNNGAKYFGIFLGQAGCQGNIPTILAYHSNNIRRQSKRVVASALQIGFGAAGGIVASTTFREKDAPKYLIGFWVTASLQFVILLILCCITPYFYLQNKRVDEGTLEEPIEGQPGFKYTL
jgi:MFS family permease